MYIKKYWGNFIGGSDDSLNLVAFLVDQKKEEIHRAGQAELGLPPDRGVSGVYTLRWRGDGLPLRH